MDLVCGFGFVRVRPSCFRRDAECRYHPVLVLLGLLLHCTRGFGGRPISPILSIYTPQSQAVCLGKMPSCFGDVRGSWWLLLVVFGPLAFGVTDILKVFLPILGGDVNFGRSSQNASYVCLQFHHKFLSDSNAQHAASSLQRKDSATPQWMLPTVRPRVEHCSKNCS